MPEYVIDEYVATVAGEPYRLLPLGKITRGGKTRNITREYIEQFRLPPFLPPIKLGSHEETTPAGGHITRLELRDDGLYAVPEFTEKGLKAWDEGDYRYHSPEIIWDDMALEDVTTGQDIPGPLIIGDALLHTPALGASVALYTYEERKNTMDVEEKLKELGDKFAALFEKIQPPAPVTVIPDEYQVAMTQRDEYKARLDEIEAQKAHAEKVKGIASELQGDAYGAFYIDLSKASEAAEYLAKMDEETRAWVLRNFSAMVAEKKLAEAVTGEIGSAVPESTVSPREQFNALVMARSAEKQLPYQSAFAQIQAENAELFAQAFK